MTNVTSVLLSVFIIVTACKRDNLDSISTLKMVDVDIPMPEQLKELNKEIQFELRFINTNKDISDHAHGTMMNSENADMKKLSLVPDEYYFFLALSYDGSVQYSTEFCSDNNNSDSDFNGSQKQDVLQSGEVSLRLCNLASDDTIVAGTGTTADISISVMAFDTISNSLGDFLLSRQNKIEDNQSVKDLAELKCLQASARIPSKELMQNLLNSDEQALKDYDIVGNKLIVKNDNSLECIDVSTSEIASCENLTTSFSLLCEIGSDSEEPASNRGSEGILSEIESWSLVEDSLPNGWSIRDSENEVDYSDYGPN